MSRNWSQEQVAYELGISQAAYSKIESGKTAIKISHLKKLSEIYQEDIVSMVSSANNSLNEITLEEIRNYQKETRRIMEDLISELNQNIQKLRESIQQE